MARPASRYKVDEDTRVSLIKQVAYRYGRPTKTGEIQDAYTLSKELGVPKGLVQSWANNLRGMGVDVPRMKRLGIYTRVFSEISSENPKFILKQKRNKK